MNRSWATTVVLALAAAGLLMAWGVLWISNPSISGTSRGDYECLAPYDTVLTHANDFRGGEAPSDSAEIARRCDAAGHDRFYLGIPFGVVGSLLSVAVIAQLWRRSGTQIT